MADIDPLTLDSAMLDEARAYLQMDDDIDDGALGALLLAAISHAEAFVGQLLIRRDVREMLAAGSGWQRLVAAPVASVHSITGIPVEGAIFVLPSSAWQRRIGADGEGHIRILRPGVAGRVEVAFVAGMATDWASLTEGLRLSVLRLAAHFHRHRDALDDPGMPTAVSALLRPWRRMQLGR